MKMFSSEIRLPGRSKTAGFTYMKYLKLSNLQKHKVAQSQHGQGLVRGNGMVAIR